MATVRASAERMIGAPAQHVYEYLADFRRHHPRILPPAFADFQVEEGGVGAGTVITFKLTVGGQTRSCRSQVAEPQRGRVLTETDASSGAVTTFTVLPEGQQCLVRIETAYEGTGGIRGFVEGLIAPRMLNRLYADELERLDRYAREQARV